MADAATSPPTPDATRSTTLLLSGSLPSSGAVGGIWLRDLLGLVPAEAVTCVSLDMGRFGPAQAETHGADCEIVTLPRPPRDAPWPRRLTLSWLQALARRTDGERLVRRAVVAGHARDVTQVVAVLEHPWIMYAAPRVAEKLDVPLHTIVWDPPVQTGPNFHLTRKLQRRMQRDFDDALRASTRCGVMTAAMGAAYAEAFDVEPVLIRHGLPVEAIAPAPLPAAAPGRPFVIGFCGSLYGEQPCQAFLAALAAQGWQLSGHPIVLRMYGRQLPIRAQGALRVDWRGFQPVDAVVRGLSECDVLYLPYMLDDPTPERFCFPTKLTTYVAAGRPVFVHGRATCSPAVFLERYPLGAVCTSLKAEAILGTLTRMAVDEALQARQRTALAAAAREVFSAAVFARQARLLLDGAPANGAAAQETEAETDGSAAGESSTCDADVSAAVG